MANRVGAFTLVVGGAVVVYAAANNKRVIDVLLMRDSTASAATPQDPNAPSQMASYQGFAAPWKKGAKPGRTDEGVDIGSPSLSPGDPIYAVGSGTLRRIDPNWYAGQPGMFFELDDKSSGHWGFYVAEQIRPMKIPGQHVSAGDRIAIYATHGTGIEYGWAASSTLTEAKATTGYKEGEVTPSGTNFRDLLKKLGIG